MKLKFSRKSKNNYPRHIQIIILFFASFCLGQSPINAQGNLENDHFLDYYTSLNAYQSGDTIKALKIFSDLFQDSEFGDLGHIYNTLKKAMETKYGLNTNIDKVRCEKGS